MTREVTFPGQALMPTAVERSPHRAGSKDLCRRRIGLREEPGAGARLERQQWQFGGHEMEKDNSIRQARWLLAPLFTLSFGLCAIGMILV